MAKFKEKTLIIEAITFEELVEYGKKNTTNIVNGMPWSFEYNGHAVTHEHNQCYLVMTQNETYRFTPQDMLVTLGTMISVCSKSLFDQIYEKVVPVEEIVKQYLKDNLKIEIDSFKDSDSRGFEVQLFLDDEIISESRVRTVSWQD